MQQVTVEYDGIHLGDKVLPLLGGSIDFWRHESRAWPRLLERALDMGLHFISVRIAWSVHESAPGVFDFGKTDDSKNLNKFLDYCQEKDLMVLARPGPNVGGGLNCAGYPERLLQRDDILARTADGTYAIVPQPPQFFPVPSYASPTFYEQVRTWYDAVCEVLAPRQFPDGPVAGVQVDNEASLWYRTQVFDVDYCDAAVSLYHDFLRERHKDVSVLNGLYGRDYARFRDILPPREFAPDSSARMPYFLDWAEYKEFLIYYGINRLAGMLRRRGMDRAFLYHNYPWAGRTPLHLPGTEGGAVALVGVDMRAGRGDYARVRDAARGLSADSGLAFVPDLGAGGSVWARPRGLREQQFAALGALMNGVKGVNYDMLADRDRWQGAPLARDGRRRPRRFDFYTNLNSLHCESGFHKTRMRTGGLLLHMRDYERFESLCSLVSPVPRELAGGLPHDWFCAHPPIQGIEESPLRLYRRHWLTLQKGFSQAGVMLAYADSDIQAEVLQRYKLVVAPSFAFMSTALQKRLLVYALKGGVLVLGPRAPQVDEYLRPSARFSSHLLDPVDFVEELDYNGVMLQRAQVFDAPHPFVESKGKCVGYERRMERGAIVFLGFLFPDYTDIERVPHVTELARRLAVRAGIEPLYPPDDPMVETVLHTGGKINVLFAANPTDDRRATSIRLGPGESLTDWFTKETIAGPAARVTLGAQTVRAFLVRKTGGG